MKKMFTLLKIPAFTLMMIINCSLCTAEKIYLKDGKVVEAEIISRSRRSVWIRQSSTSGAIGVSIQNIDRIENDDGSISRYDYKSLYKKSLDYIKQKMYGEAARLCSRLLESFPNNTQIRYLHGLLNHKIGKFDEAIEDYEYLIEYNSADVNVFNNLGIIYADMRKYNQAISCLDRAAKEDPNNTEVLYNLGIAYMNSGNYPKAKEQLRKVLAIKPGDNDTKNALEYINKNEIKIK